MISMKSCLLQYLPYESLEFGAPNIDISTQKSLIKVTCRRRRRRRMRRRTLTLTPTWMRRRMTGTGSCNGLMLLPV